MNKTFRFILYAFTITLSQPAFSVRLENIISKDCLIVQEALPSINSSITQEESEVIAYLDSSYIEDKLFYKRLSDAEIVFNANILSKKIELLEETLSKTACPDKLHYILEGLGTLSISICWALVVGYALHKSYTEFRLKNFKNIYFSADMIEQLSSVTINQEEKDYLDTFSFENIHFEYVKDNFGLQIITDSETGMTRLLSQADIIEDKIARLSPTEKEKIRHIALRSSIDNFKWDPVLGLIGFIPLLVSFVDCTERFKKIIYEINIETDLKQKKQIYSLLKKEQEYRNLSLQN